MIDPSMLTTFRRELRSALGTRETDASVPPRLEAAALQKLIDRQLVLSFLKQKNLAVSKQDVDLVVQRLEQQLKARNRTLKDFLREQHLTAERLRANYLWSLSWRRFLDRYLTDANLQDYFAKHSGDFDGTRLRVAHILWKATTADQVRELSKTLCTVRDDIMAKRLTFADAAREFSQAPTAERGGEIGWIERHQPMPDAFSNAAYALKVGQVSEPITTSFGVHLIQCLEIEPGTRQWHEVRGDLEPAVSAYLFQWAADKQRTAQQNSRERRAESREQEGNTDAGGAG